MGRDKLSLEVGGVPLLRRAADSLSARCEEVLVVGDGGEEVMLPARCRRILDLRSGREGPLAGIEAGLAAARHDLAFVVAGDMPFIPPELVAFLLGKLPEHGVSVVVPRYGGRIHPLCAAYDRGVLPELQEALDGGVRAVRELLGTLEVCYVERELRSFGEPGRFLMSVNSPEDLERARTGER